MINKSTITLAVLFFLIFGTVFANTDDSLTNLANEIAMKRTLVEELSSELEILKNDYNQELKSITNQKGDIEVQIKREELKLKQVDRDLNEFQGRIDEDKKSLDGISPVVLKALEELKRTTRSGLPFHVSEREKDIEKIERIIADGRVDSGTILARVWNMLEAEFRLTSENGIYRQTITIGGEEQLVEVARLGMVLMYFKTFDDRYGYVYQDSDLWKYDYLYDRDEEDQVKTLFESLRKNLREGYFELPNPVVSRS